MSRQADSDQPSTKPKRELIEGKEAFERFDTLVRSVLSVPRSFILEREAEYKRQVALNPRKRGPKPKRKSAASRAPAAVPPS